jgi:hypothetical protein
MPASWLHGMQISRRVPPPDNDRLEEVHLLGSTLAHAAKSLFSVLTIGRYCLNLTRVPQNRSCFAARIGFPSACHLIGVSLMGCSVRP